MTRRSSDLYDRIEEYISHFYKKYRLSGGALASSCRVTESV
jgi:hypothetical protein